MKKLILKLKGIKYYIFDIFLIFIYIIIASMYFPKFVILGIIIVWLIYLFIIFVLSRHNRKIGSYFYLYNIFTYGFRGKGKDLLTQFAIIKQFKRPYKKQIRKLKKSYKNESRLIDFDSYVNEYFYNNPNYLSNIDYGYGCRIITPKEFILYTDKTKKFQLTHNRFIQDNKSIYMEKVAAFEGKNLYLSDSQIYFPASYFKDLVKEYPSFPIFIQLARHLYNMNVNINSQTIDLVWDKLRNQQDLSISVIDSNPKNKSFKQRISSYLPFFRKYIITKFIVYQKQQSAIDSVLPFVPSPGIKDRAVIKMEKKKFDSEYGKIIPLRILVNKKYIQYDSRVFHKIVFGYQI